MRPDGRPSGPGRPEMARVFFALWPEAEVAARLADIALDTAGRWGGRPARQDTLHLTLAFLGDVAPDKLPRVMAAAAEVREPGFAFSLEHLGYWRHNRILWAGGEGVPGLRQLAASLHRQLGTAGFDANDGGRAFVPHVTLVRKVPGPPPPLPPLGAMSWICREFVLVRSRLSAKGAAYERIGCWPLDE